MQSTSRNLIGCPGPSLWSLIVEHVPRSEMQKIYATLGRSLVDTYTELHDEAVMWHKIWQDSQQGGPLGDRPRGPLAHSRSPLADPPVIKELVRAEVKMLLENLQEKFFREGRHDKEFLNRYNAKTVNFALGRLDISVEPRDELRRPSSCCSVQSQEEIEAVKDKLNISDINKVVEHIKSILVEECAALKPQVQHIQEMIKKQCRSQTEDKEAEPTLADLKELRGAIQKDFELYPSPPSTVSEKALRATFRLPSGQKSGDKKSLALTATSLLRPHPPSAPPGLTHLNFCGSVRPINTLEAISRTSLQHTSQREVCSRTSRQKNVRLKTLAGEQVALVPSHSEEEESDLHWRFLTCSSTSPFMPSQYLQPG
ncbi:coiled-coil domain-containing protein 24 isoform X1 [Entelurus aequoreus]|uniref:coiled-coil domain-containing protein 24 isoform X1 n=1 Tax=Entelurus aequoreus TaxID=161455 RepID=UPI002B1D98D6|nr:coiled-coil domain-containing protein 24 isoform X1 [Entelurus aequoreus]XP_061879684.1 coiled-coil domain-containing protein 24 isoform X1 [Entelurus aequoreus]XP_061879685.1 coiled-coil domain-containing protein 24 isoform X1 [Entelurus aequoreus]XP_061879686.1 coiled-coil domain-containing protein 24 isoform X1 [Entelurus aequoreus]